MKSSRGGTWCRDGIDDVDEIEDILHHEVDAPPGLREALGDIAPGPILARVNVLMKREKEPILAATNGQWEDLDSRSRSTQVLVVHVCAPADCPGYQLQESPGSRHSREFLMGDGGTIANLGQKQLNLSDNSVGNDLQSVFQIAAVTRPLILLGRYATKVTALLSTMSAPWSRARRARSFTDSIAMDPEVFMSPNLNREVLSVLTGRNRQCDHRPAVHKTKPRS